MTDVTLTFRTQMLGDVHVGVPHGQLVADSLLRVLNTTLNSSRDVSRGDVTVTAADMTSQSVQYDRHVARYPQAALVSLCVLLGCMIVATVLGNVFVITAILVERSLQAVSNYLVLSLAVTDLLVAVLVMPLSLLNEVSVHWYLGRALCDMWVSMDVLCCTASILHLVAIAFDRFWAVNNVDYIRRRCARQILLMIAVVWLVSVAISIPPLFGWRHEKDNPELTGACMISQDHGYTIFSTVGAFYCPLVLMLVLNFKIYRAARYRIRRKGFLQGGRTHAHGRGVHIPVPVVHVEQETTAQATNRDSSGSDMSNEGVSMYNPSCVVNHELSRTDTAFDSTTADFDRRFSYYPGESTSDSYPYDSYYPVATEDPDHEYPPPSPTLSLSAACSHWPDKGEDRLCIDSDSPSTSQLRPSNRTLSSNHLAVPGSNFLHVPDPHLLFVPIPHHLVAPSPHFLTVPVPQHLSVPTPHPTPSQNHVSVPNSLPVPDANDLPECESNHIDIEPHILLKRDSYPLAVLGSPCGSSIDLSRRSSSEIDPLNLQDGRHLAVPESTEIDDPDPDEIVVTVCHPPATTTDSSKLVQFNTRVKVEGDTDASETSNSLKPGEDECLPADVQSTDDTDTSQDRADSMDDTATICCANKILGIELSCISSSQQEREESSQLSSKTALQRPIPVLEVPVVTIRKDSCSQYMSESRCLTPAFHSSSSPSTTTTNTSGTSSSQGNQLTVPQLGGGALPSAPQPSRSQGNNNTKRFRNREKEKQRREKLEMRRERKAARVLGIITGAFVLCWLPFFIMALLVPFLPAYCYVPPFLTSFFLWLGYFNSLLNPIIYTVFNPSFRTAFRKIFFKRLRSVTRS